MSIIEQCTNIKFCVLLQKLPLETGMLYQKGYCESEIKKKSEVHEWQENFYESCVSDDVHRGHLSTVTNNKIIELLKKLLKVTERNLLRI